MRSLLCSPRRLLLLLSLGLWASLAIKPAAATPMRAITPPIQPLLGAAIAPDGALFVIDARYVLYELEPTTLAPRRRSQPFATAFSDKTVHMVATVDEVWFSSPLLGTTARLRRRDFQMLDQLDRYGPFAIESGKRLFLVHDAALWVYELAHLDATPRALIPPWTERQFTGERALDLAINPEANRLYATTYGAFGSAPHNPELLHLFALDTLEEIAVEDYAGHLLTPAVARKSGETVILLQGKSGLLGSRLMLWAGSGDEKREFGPLDGRAHLLRSDGAQIYLVRETGLWLLDGRDGTLLGVMPFLQSPPKMLLLSPDDTLLYLLGNGWATVIAIADLAKLAVMPVADFPNLWLHTNGYEQTRQVYTTSSSPLSATQISQTAALRFALLDGALYRTNEDGRHWYFDPTFTYPLYRPLTHLSISPDFAIDQTVIAHASVGATLYRSTDGGAQWLPWLPPVAFTSDRNGNREIYVVETLAQGAANPFGASSRAITADPAGDENPAWSPGWTRVVFQSNRRGNWDLFSVRAACVPTAPEDCDLRQLTDDPADDLLPAWSPDGKTIAFVSLRDGNAEIYRMNADGSAQQRITDHPNGDWRPAWTPDGRLLFTSDRAGTNDIYQVTLQGVVEGIEPVLTPLIATPADERDVATNSRGDLLFRSDHDGMDRVYRVSADRLARQQLDLGTEPFDPYAYDYDRAARPGGHPSWLAMGSEELILFATEELSTTAEAANGVIYGLPSYALAADESYRLLDDTVGFEGEPAGGPVWWVGE